MARHLMKRTGLVVMGVFALAAMAGCQTSGSITLGGSDGTRQTAGVQAGPGHGPPAHAPAHGYRAKYNYRYYPDAQVYFDVNRNVYFYLKGGEWTMSVSSPASIKVKLGDHVSIEMDSDKPYTEFKKHKAKYPPGQMKKKKKKWAY